MHDIRFVTRSGSFAFDLSAQGAIEAAGNAPCLRPAARRLGRRRAPGELLLQARGSMKRLSRYSCWPRSRRRRRWRRRTPPPPRRPSGSAWTTPGNRPGLVVLPGAGLDSVRAMVRRDLDYTDRFEMITWPTPPPRAREGRGSAEAADR